MHWSRFHLILPLFTYILGSFTSYSLGVDHSSSAFLFSCFGICMLFVLRFSTNWKELISSTIVRIYVISFLFFFLGTLRMAQSEFRKGNDAENDSQRHYFGEVVDAKVVANNFKMISVELDRELIQDSVFDRAGKVLLTVGPDCELPKLGDVLLFSGKFEGFKNSSYPGSFDAEFYYQAKGFESRAFVASSNIKVVGHRSNWYAPFSDLRSQLVQLMAQSLDSKVSGIACALLLGDRSLIENDTLLLFSNTGTMHFLAVSGLHVGILIVIVQRFLSLFSRFISKRNSLILALIFAWFYAFLTGASPSILRSVFMFTFLVMGTLLYRKNAGLNSLFLSALILLGMDPWMMFDIGFQLSYCAVIGIMLFYTPIVELIVIPWKWLDWLWKGSVVGIAATIFTFPLTLFWFHQFPNYFLLSNVVVMCLGTALLLAGVIFVCIVKIPIIGKLTGFVFSLGLLALLYVLKWIDSWPGAVSAGFQLSLIHVFVIYVLLLILYFWRNNVARLTTSVGVLCMLLLISLNRFNQLESSSMIVLNEDQFMSFVSYGNADVCIVDPDLPQQKRERLIHQMEQYSGKDYQQILLATNLKIELNGNAFMFRKQKEGVAFSVNQKTKFYRTSGYATSSESPRLRSARIQRYVDPSRPALPYVVNF